MSDVANTPPAQDSAETQHGDANLRSPGFIGLFITQILGVFNDNLLRWFAVPIAQPIIGLEKAIALGGLCITLPYLLFMPMAGWMADRFPKRSVIVYCKFAELVLMLLAVLAMVYGSLWMLFVLVFLLGTQAALFGPAKFGSIPEILPTRLLSKANGIIGMGTIVAAGVGTIVSYPLFAHTHPVLGSGDWTAFWPIAVAIVPTALFGVISALPMPSKTAACPDRPFAWNPKSDIEPALKVIFRNSHLMGAALGIAFFFFIASLAQQNLPRFTESVLHLPKADVGMLMGVLMLGVGAGSLLAGSWSDGKVELGIIPIGAVGIVLSCLFTFAAGASMNPDFPAKEQFAYWGSCVGLFFMGTSSGLFSVPLEAYLQFKSDPKQRGLVLAGSFFITYVCIIASLGVFFVLSEPFALSSSVIFLAGGLFTVPVLFYSLRILPDWTFRFVTWLVMKTFYRIRVHGRHHIPESGPAVIVCNHVSFLDGVIMMIGTPRFSRYVIYADFTQLPVLSWLGRMMRVIPIRAADGPKSIVRSIQTARDALNAGEVVCIFAEGGLTRTGQLQPFQRGLTKIVQGLDVPIVPASLHGLWGSIFSWRGGPVFKKWPRQWRLTVDLTFGKPLQNVDDIGLIRQSVEYLNAEAATMDARTEALIPARRFVRNCKRALGVKKVVDSTNVELTNSKLLIASLALRSVLRRDVLDSSEQTVGVLLPPSAGGCLANMALALDRRTSVNLNYTLSEDVIQYCVNKAGLKHIITSRKFLEKKPYKIQGAEYVFLEDLKPKISAIDKLKAAACTYLLPASIVDRLLGLHKVHTDDALTIIFTSGSTGEPKGVVLSHANVGSNIDGVDQILNLQPEDGMLGVLPFFHSFGYTACLWLPMCYRSRGVYHFNPLDARVVGKMCEEHKITIMMATPTFLKMYMRACKKENFETVNLIVVGAEKLPVDLAKEFEERFGILPTEGYGTTELSPVVAVNIPPSRCVDKTQPAMKLGTVGRPIPGVTAKVVDPETFENRGIGTEGLLLISGPNVMRGYLDEPQKTSEVIREGWYNTGDFAILDKEGFVTITGRQSRFSKIGGEMVPHIAIEQELVRICEPGEQQDSMINLAVTAVPDESRGERIIVLYTTLSKPVDVAIRELAQTGLPKLWLPSADSFIQVESIPMLGTGKLDLRGIKDLALQACCEEVSR